MGCGCAELGQRSPHGTGRRTSLAGAGARAIPSRWPCRARHTNGPRRAAPAAAGVRASTFGRPLSAAGAAALGPPRGVAGAAAAWHANCKWRLWPEGGRGNMPVVTTPALAAFVLTRQSMIATTRLLCRPAAMGVRARAAHPGLDRLSRAGLRTGSSGSGLDSWARLAADATESGSTASNTAVQPAPPAAKLVDATLRTAAVQAHAISCTRPRPEPPTRHRHEPGHRRAGSPRISASSGGRSREENHRGALCRPRVTEVPPSAAEAMGAAGSLGSPLRPGSPVPVRIAAPRLSLAMRCGPLPAGPAVMRASRLSLIQGTCGPHRPPITASVTPLRPRQQLGAW